MKRTSLEYALINGVIMCRDNSRTVRLLGTEWLQSSHTVRILQENRDHYKEHWLREQLLKLVPESPIDYTQKNADMRGQLEAISGVLRLEEIRRILETTEARGNP